jgi:hypothetical protein
VRLAALLERFPRLWCALLAVFSALPALLALRGFTVDDALISARVATHLAAGAGYRFNATGPVVDAVTPLGWAHLLALGGPAEPLEMLERARWVGAVGWLAAVATLGALLARTQAFGRNTALVLLALCGPPAVWATSGMETGFVALFATLALATGPAGALAGGFAAALRPELVPFSCVLAVGSALLVPEPPRARALRVLGAIGLGAGPAILVALVRLMVFGSPAPLALSAKPPDLLPGLRYAFVAALEVGPVLLLVAPLAFRRSAPPLVRVALAVLAHFVSMALAGGDWMPLFRLAIPVVPAVLYAGALVSEIASRRAQLARATLAVLVSAFVTALAAWPARGVLDDRRDIVGRLRGALREAHVTATVDVGFVGAATPGAVLDLAGVTDPTVARLPGGHTSKRVPEGLLESRGVDHVVLALRPGTSVAAPWQNSMFGHAVAAHLARTPLLESFELVAEVPLGRTPYRYVVARRPDPPGLR